MIKLGRSILAGLLAGLAALVVAVAGGWALHFDPDVGNVLSGSPFTQLPLAGWLAAILVALLGALAIAVGYAFVFEFVTRSAAWWIGAMLGVLQAGGLWLAVGVLTGRLPDASLVVAGELSILFNNLLVIAWLAAFHVTYGAVVALVYGRTKHRPSNQLIVTWSQLGRSTKQVE